VAAAGGSNHRLQAMVWSLLFPVLIIIQGQAMVRLYSTRTFKTATGCWIQGVQAVTVVIAATDICESPCCDL
jgi:hypothetical protein